MRWTYVLLVALVLALAIWLLCCTNRNNPLPIYYHYDHDNQTIKDVSELRDGLYKTVDILNFLMSEYEMEDRFELKEIKHLVHGQHENYLSDKAAEHKDNIVIYIEPDLYFENAHFSTSDLWINIPVGVYYNSTVLMHEIAHKFLHDANHMNIDDRRASLSYMPHASNDGFGLDCQLNRNNPCVNLMHKFYSGPFNMLLTESQRRWIIDREVKLPCTDSHVYPKDLITNDIESEIDCCQTLPIINREIYENIIEATATDEEYELVNNFVRFLEQSREVCLMDINFDTIPYLESLVDDFEGMQSSMAVAPIISFIKLPELGIPVSENQNKTFNKKLLVARTLIWAKTAQCRSMKSVDLFDREAEYLNQGIGHGASDYSRMRRTTCEYELLHLKDRLKAYIKSYDLDIPAPIIDNTIFNYDTIPKIDISTDSIKFNFN